MINVARRTDVHWIAATVLIVDLAAAIGAPIGTTTSSELTSHYRSVRPRSL